MPGADVALGVGMHVCESAVPEEPDVLFVGDGRGVKEMLVDFGVGTQVKQVVCNGMHAVWHGIDICVHYCVLV